MGYAKPGRGIYAKKYYSSVMNTEVVKEQALCYTYPHHMRVDNGSASCYILTYIIRGLTIDHLYTILTSIIISIISFAVALAWLPNNPAVTAPIIGPWTREQLTGNLQV